MKKRENLKIFFVRYNFGCLNSIYFFDLGVVGLYFFDGFKFFGRIVWDVDIVCLF